LYSNTRIFLAIHSPVVHCRKYNLIRWAGMALTDRTGSNGAGRPARGDGSAHDRPASGAPTTLADADAHESLVYILALLKPLADIAKTKDLEFLAFLLEMSVLEAAELETKHRKPRPERSASA
jgi:hypothetical protein